jgi:hypothetical protein
MSVGVGAGAAGAGTKGIAELPPSSRPVSTGTGAGGNISSHSSCSNLSCGSVDSSTAGGMHPRQKYSALQIHFPQLALNVQSSSDPAHKNLAKRLNKYLLVSFVFCLLFAFFKNLICHCFFFSFAKS